jgi:hypothetical protein
VWTGFVWLRIGSSDELHEHGVTEKVVNFLSS